jgi:hypothetical protein
MDKQTMDNDLTRLLQDALFGLSDFRRQRAEKLHEAELEVGDATIHGNRSQRELSHRIRAERQVSLHCLDSLIVTIRERLGTANPEYEPF